MTVITGLNWENEIPSVNHKPAVTVLLDVSDNLQPFTVSSKCQDLSAKAGVCAFQFIKLK